MESKGPDRKELLKSAVVRIEQLEKRLATAEQRQHEPIAIVGIGCRFPGGADNPDAFWQLLRDGVGRRSSRSPPDRWDIDAFYDPDPDAPGKMYARARRLPRRRRSVRSAVLRHRAARSAAAMDPQQRLLLEVAWEALEHAGIAPDALRRHRRPACSSASMQQRLRHRCRRIAANLEAIDAYIRHRQRAERRRGPACRTCSACTGRAWSVDTACSSSLVAVHLACQSLRSGECGLALAGGVNLILLPKVT